MEHSFWKFCRLAAVNTFTATGRSSREPPYTAPRIKRVTVETTSGTGGLGGFWPPRLWMLCLALVTVEAGRSGFKKMERGILTFPNIILKTSSVPVWTCCRRSRHKGRAANRERHVGTNLQQLQVV
ncbi:hypothetical protein EYF80_026124 [Liparis tanakae]|uniref:Uncharacterized protein n=1 Tax=Liparis tanakae TaxID=230148 RepID=A0A4Z2HDA9_9TELE|nr:hypothetical protein EYF80_026124 [Liparis tanakae]